MFQRGDVVVLKSSGPRMTINEVEGRNVHCVWFIGAEQKYAHFDCDSVQKAEDRRAQAQVRPVLAAFQRRA
jgi:uncharacterized protein YodC (DUF2158 family)